MNETESRKTITVTEETFEELDDRRTGTWDEFLRRLIQIHSTAEPGEEVDVSPGSIEDIASTTARRTAEELETRLR